MRSLGELRPAEKGETIEAKSDDADPSYLDVRTQSTAFFSLIYTLTTC